MPGPMMAAAIVPLFVFTWPAGIPLTAAIRRLYPVSRPAAYGCAAALGPLTTAATTVGGLLGPVAVWILRGGPLATGVVLALDAAPEAPTPILNDLQLPPCTVALTGTPPTSTLRARLDPARQPRSPSSRGMIDSRGSVGQYQVVVSTTEMLEHDSLARSEGRHHGPTRVHLRVPVPVHPHHDPRSAFLFTNPPTLCGPDSNWPQRRPSATAHKISKSNRPTTRVDHSEPGTSQKPSVLVPSCGPQHSTVSPKLQRTMVPQ
jgi:hypothetical protein